MTSLKGTTLLIGSGVASLLLGGMASRSLAQSQSAQGQSDCCVARAGRAAGMTFRVQPRMNLQPLVRLAGLGLPPEDGKVIAADSFVIVEDDNTVSVQLKDGKITSLEHNGKKIPLDRVQRDGDTVRILDKDGDTVFEFQVKTLDKSDAVEVHGFALGARPVRGLNLNQLGGLTLRGLGGQGGVSSLAEIADQPEPPKVMIGVQLAEPDPSLRGHFDLEEGAATLVSAVYEDLPADQAGLAPYDIIVAVEGNEPAGQDAVRASLRDHDEGDTIRLTVIQKGKRKELEIKVAKYDQEKLNEAEVHSIESGAAAWWGNPGQSMQFFRTPGSPDVWQGQLPGQQQAPLMLKRYFDADRAREDAAQAREGAEKARSLVEKAMRRRGEAVERSQGAGDDRMARIEERLVRLEQMLEKAIERVERRQP